MFFYELTNIQTSLGYTEHNYLDHDIAILEMKEEVDLKTYTPACLASATFDDDANGKMFTAAGWGFIDYAKTKASAIPREAQLTGKECYDPERKDRTICTDPLTGTGILQVRINAVLWGYT